MKHRKKPLVDKATDAFLDIFEAAIDLSTTLYWFGVIGSIVCSVLWLVTHR